MREFREALVNANPLEEVRKHINATGMLFKSQMTLIAFRNKFRQEIAHKRAQFANKSSRYATLFALHAGSIAQSAVCLTTACR